MTKVKIGEYARFKVKVYPDALVYPISVGVKRKYTGDRVTLSLSRDEVQSLIDALTQAVYDTEVL